MSEEFFMCFAYTAKCPFRHTKLCRMLQSHPITNVKLDTNGIVIIIYTYKICLFNPIIPFNMSSRYDRCNIPYGLYVLCFLDTLFPHDNNLRTSFKD